ncbi:MAG: glycosyltransferase family 1 protein [Chloroflexota bacterium]|nr:glycosyltransferase family 1 protein [Chloroflexota bacterium]
MLIGMDYTAAARQRAGIGRYTRELIKALLASESLYQFVIFAATGGMEIGDWRLEIEGSSVKFRTLPLSDDWIARLWHRLRLPIPVETVTGPLDIFYSPDFVLPPTRRSTRTLLTVHDLSFLHYPDAFVPSLRRYLERVVPRSIARADRVLADSEATRADLIAHLGTPLDKVHVLYSGVDARFRPGPEPGESERLQARYGVGDQPYVLSVGTLQPRKNYVRLIRAFASLVSETQLVIAGGRGWLYQDIFAEAEKHGDRVRILGFVDEADLPALYRNAALCAFPSLYEGFGLPVLEAMACGVPVVSSSVSSLPEVAGDAALLVDPLDTAGLAEAMARVLADADLRHRMVTRGYAQATQFTWERAARQLLDTFGALSET